MDNFYISSFSDQEIQSRVPGERIPEDGSFVVSIQDGTRAKFTLCSRCVTQLTLLTGLTSVLTVNGVNKVMTQPKKGDLSHA